MKDNPTIRTILLALAVALPAYGQTNFTGGTGGTGTDLNTAGNWDNGLPTNDGTNDGTVPDGFPGLTGSPGGKKITVEGNSSFNTNSFSGGGADNYDVTVNGTGSSTFTSNSTFIGWSDGAANASTFTWNSSGTMETYRLWAGRFSPGTFHQTNGTVVINGDFFMIGEGSGAVGSSVNFSGAGTLLTTAKDMTARRGECNLDGGTVEVDRINMNDAGQFTCNLSDGTIRTNDVLFNANGLDKINFTTGSTAKLQVRDDSIAVVEGMITNGDIQLGGATATLVDFTISTVDIGGTIYTQVETLPAGDPAIEAPGSVALASTSLPSGAVTRTFNVGNFSGSTLDLTISSVTFTGGDAGLFSSPVLPGVLTPGTRGEISFTFTPSSNGSFSTTMQVASNDPKSPKDIALSVNVVEDPSLAAPGTYNFENATTSPVTEFINISNTGLTQTLNITSVTPVGFDAAQFTVDSFPGTIAPGGNADIEVTFTPPGTPGAYSTDLEIVSDSTGGSPVAIILNITVIPPSNASLVAYWPFDVDNAGTTPDALGGHDGILQNSAAITTGTLGFGGVGEALSLGGGSGTSAPHVTTANPTTFDFNSDFTWHAYIKTSSGSGGIFGRAPATPTIHNQGSKSLFLSGNNPGWDTGWVGVVSSGVAVNDNTWHQVIATYVAATDQLDIHVDPVVGAGAGQYSGIHDVNRFDEHTHVHNGDTADTSFRIGQVSDNFRSDVINGLIDEAAVFDGALNGPQLDQLITSGPGSFMTAAPPLTLEVLGVTGTTVSMNATGIPAGDFHIKQSTDGQNWSVLPAPFDFTSATAQPFSITVDPGGNPTVLLRAFDGTSP